MMLTIDQQIDKAHAESQKLKVLPLSLKNELWQQAAS
jgi:hypothetical protein